MTIALYNVEPLPLDAFVASVAELIKGERLVIDFTVVVSGSATEVRFFLEFAEDDPNAAATIWRRELAEEDQNNGVVQMSKVIRTFKENGGANLAVGTHEMSISLIREHKFVRLQAGIVSGAGTATMTALERNGMAAITPS